MMIRAARSVLLASFILPLLCAAGRAEEGDIAQVQVLDRQIAEAYRAQRFDDAIAAACEALALREKTLGPEHLDVAVILNTLGLLYSKQGRYDDAEPVYRRVLAIREKALGPDHPDLARSLNNLGTLNVARGRYAEAEPFFKRSVRILEKALGPEHGDVATALGNLGLLYVRLGWYTQAEPLYTRSLAIREKLLGPDHPELGTILNNLASLYVDQGRYAAAEPLYRRSIALKEKALGPEHPELANALDNLGYLYAEQGRSGEAEGLYRRALAMREKLFGPEHPDIAVSLNNLAEMYRQDGRYNDAKALFRRSLTIREKVLGPDHPYIALTLNNLAALYDSQQRYDDAEALYKKSLAIREKVLGREHPDYARNLNNLAVLYDNQGRYGDAEALYRQSLAIWEKAVGPEHTAVAVNLNNLASVYAKQGRYDDAEPLYRRSLAILEQNLGGDHPDIAMGLFNLAVVHREQGQTAEAYAASRRAVALLASRLAREQGERSGRDSNERRRFRDLFLLHVALSQAQPGRAAEPPAESFRVAQLASASSAARAVAGMAARFAAGDDALAAVIRERQDLAQRWSHLDAEIVQIAANPPAERDAAAEAALRAKFAETGTSLDALDARIGREFPAFAELSNPKPLELTDAQKLLAADEAMLVYLVGPNYGWLWVLRRDSAALERIEIGEAALGAEVSALRERLDPDRNPDLAPFPAIRAHALYQKIVAPAAPLLRGTHQVFVVPDGALESLPFGVLIAQPPATDPKTLADHRDLAWLLRDYALTVLPSVGALRGLRQFASASHADKPFIGIGDPVLKGSADQTRGAKPARLFRGAAADIEAVRSLPPLPETAEELRSVAKALGGDDQDLYLAERASEPLVRTAGLERFRVVEFATHGLVSGDLPGLAEPALVLTPPNEAHPDNDGLLTASKIATLKLNADWVVLSACNTAAGDGTPDAGGLSGLAKSFFYAGARSVLVSHWSVPSRSTAKLVTDAVEVLKHEPAIGRAEALRRAEMAMLGPMNPPEFAHPLAWAPFILAGEGGPGH